MSEQTPHEDLSRNHMMFPRSVPLDSYFYDHPNYTDIRRAKLMMFGDSLNKYEEFSAVSRAQKTEIIKNLERGCYNLARTKGSKKGFDISWDNENFTNLYHDICYKLAMNIDMESVVGSAYLTKMILSGTVSPANAAALSSQEMAPDKYVDVLNKLRMMNEEVKIKTSKLYTCGKCKHQETVLTQIQNRSLDENSNLIAVCVYCSNRWQING